jgi:DNA primase
MRIPDRALAEIQSRLDLAEVVGEYTTLARRGGRWWGCCPFHQEKTPSFSVTPEKGVFYCFGCHKGGGLFQFVMEAEKVPFRDAVELLAKKAGVELPREEEEPGGIRRETFLELNRRVAGSFRWLLRESPGSEAARRYLAKRNVSEATAEAFQLGWAPPDRRWLWKFLVGKSYTPDFLARTGLFSEPRGGTERPSLFADRIMFPIANARGEVLAFGGRAMGDAQPKYLNSPETAFFRKGENLYGIEKAGSAIREAGCFHLVEGYVDVLAMHQAGVTNTVAPLGTALTEPQVRALKRWAGAAVLVFDGDEAGRKATLRAIELCERQEVSASVVVLPAGRDPADYVQAGEEDALRSVLAGKRPSFAFLVDEAAGRFGSSGAEAKEQVRDFLFPFIAAATSRLRAEEYLRQAAYALGASTEAVGADFGRWQDRQRGRVPAAGPSAVDDAAMTPDLFLVLALAANRDLFPGVRSGGAGLADLEDARARALWVALEEGFRGEEAGLDALLARLEDTGLRELVVRKAASGEFDENPDRIVADSVRRIRQRSLRRAREAVEAKLRRLEGDRADRAAEQELLAEKQHLDSELSKLGV